MNIVEQLQCSIKSLRFIEREIQVGIITASPWANAQIV